VKATQEGLELSIEEFASKNKSQQAFDADIAPYGILALLLKAEITVRKPIEFRNKQYPFI